MILDEVLMPTMADVAKLAGVSSITVSRVLADSAPVNEETRKRVLAAIEELGYVPNILARSFRSKRTSLLALVLSDITNPFWTTVTRGAEDAARKHGFHLILCNTDAIENNQDEYLHMLLQRQIDGVILVPATPNPEPIKAIQAQGVPLVILDRRRIPGVEVDVVCGDSEGGAYKLVELLLSLGHRHIALLNGPNVTSSAVDRLAGYRAALEHAGLNVNDENIYEGEFAIESGYEMAHQALSITPPPTALFAANNFILFGALRCVHDLGLRVPEDIAMVGFDDIPDYLTIDPFFTVAAQPAYELGQHAMELLIARVERKASDAFQEIVLPTRLVIRKSSGQPLSSQS
jgi:LacI family transcriptional regulator